MTTDLTVTLRDHDDRDLAARLDAAREAGEWASIHVDGSRFDAEVIATAAAPSTPSVWVAVVEWNEETGETPDVFVGTEEDEVTRRAQACVAEYTRAITGHSEAGRWLTENPAPAADADAQMLADWYEGWHDETGDGWITVTEETVHGGDAAPQAEEGDHPEDHEPMARVRTAVIDGEEVALTRAACSCGWAADGEHTDDEAAALDFEAHVPNVAL